MYKYQLKEKLKEYKPLADVMKSPCNIHYNQEGDLLPPHEVDDDLMEVMTYSCTGEALGFSYIKKVEGK